MINWIIRFGIITGVMLMMVALWLGACQCDNCQDAETYCNGNIIMICAGGDWEVFDNCETLYYVDGGISDGFCCETSEGAECMEGCHAAD